MVEDSSVHLIVTSPPYWQLKDYGVDNQIGFNNTYEEYIHNLNIVWKECERVLSPGCRLCVNIGDQFARAAYYGRYKIMPIHSEIIRFCEIIGMDHMGSIIWKKQTNMHTTGGQKVMGSYPYPRGGIVKMDYEYILLFKKLGNPQSVSYNTRKESALTHEEWQTVNEMSYLICNAIAEIIEHQPYVSQNVLEHAVARVVAMVLKLNVDMFGKAGGDADHMAVLIRHEWKAIKDKKID